MKAQQLELFKKGAKAYGGTLRNTIKGRATPRPLTTRSTMHLVLKSTKARGEWSFKRARNETKIKEIVERFSAKYAVQVLSLANVGNHLHFQIKLRNRFTYRPFIRAVTSAIAMAVTGRSRWSAGSRHASRQQNAESRTKREKFWDYRPFTRIVESVRAFLNLRDYIKINQLEGIGYSRASAREIIARGQVQSRARLETG